MEGLKIIEELFVVALGVGFILAAVAVCLGAWRWMWKQRGIGFAEGWFQVVDQRDIHARTRGAAPAQAPGHGESTTESRMIPPLGGTWAPEPTKRAPVGPPRYLVPTEKE
jgi:hypothetical protein